MLVKACFKNKDYNYFVDKENGMHRNYGDIFMCDDDLAEERIQKGLVKKATKKEEKEYFDSIDTNDDGDITVSTEQQEQQMIDDINNNCN